MNDAKDIIEDNNTDNRINELREETPIEEPEPVVEEPSYEQSYEPPLSEPSGDSYSYSSGW